MTTLRYRVLLALLLALPAAAAAQHQDKFRQLDELLPTPNAYRTASGAPGHDYWQQKVDYDIDVELDEERHWITGMERVTYRNNSPDTLRFLWVQLDQNNFAPDSIRQASATTRGARRNPVLSDSVTFRQLDSILTMNEFEGGHRITAVLDRAGKPMDYTINQTMMRLDLKEPLRPGKSVKFSINWNYPINDHDKVPGRTGRQFFKDDGNWVYEIAQWFPRLAAYTDLSGWQIKQFITTEFTLEFGDYRVSITVPDDYIVAATGELQNARRVLTQEQRERLERAKTAESPVMIVTPEEAKQSEQGKPGGTKTWVFEAGNVRDFAWAASRKFIWDAMGHELEGNFTLAMSYWPKEGEPLWSQYSTHSIIQALEIYGRKLFPNPYPVMISVNGPVGGMEYPMITFNGTRPAKDGTYSARQKYGLISVIIHEVGHNWFPMVVNSDERQWTWMDEGLNSFVQFMAEQAWQEDYPSRRGDPRNLLRYLDDPNKVPIMTEGDSLLQRGNNAYGKVAVALNVLRETVLGRELFDFAFREYARRWKFKRPGPADFFRTMEDASGADLDWFWRGWFYTNDHLDLSIEAVHLYTMDSGDPDVDRKKDREEKQARPKTISSRRNAELRKRVDLHAELLDFYNDFDEFAVHEEEREKFKKMVEGLDDRQRELLGTKKNYYIVDFKNEGGLVTPIVLQIKYKDATEELTRIPAEIWRYDAVRVSKMIVTDKEIESLQIDPFEETGDVDRNNNRFPRRVIEARFKVKKREDPPKNPMQKAKEREENANKDDEKSEETEETGEESE